MARIDTLTAYKCRFRYMQRNNPLLEDQREEIKSGNEPQFRFEDLISHYIINSDKLLIGKNSGKAISLSKDRIIYRTFDNIKSWYISPIAGKQGQPITVVKKSTGKRYDFASDAAALYNYHFFVYENKDVTIAIFHRQNSSGCKSVFLETANYILKDKGIRLEMDLIAPLSDTIHDVKPTKITLQYTENNTYSDIADSLRKKRIVVRDLGLNLEADDNTFFAKILKNFKLGKINKETAFIQIKNELKLTEDFNDVEVRFKIGKRTRNVSWNEFENIVGVHDITDELHASSNQLSDYAEELKRLADKYYYEIIKSEVIDND